MSHSDLVVSGRRVVTPHGVVPASVAVSEGVIRSVEPLGSTGGDGRLDAGDLIVMPGLVDTHVHVNEPGHAEWEGFRCATRAAAAGGVTTIVDMPLNSSPVTTTARALAAKADAARDRCWVDYGFWGGIVPGNEGHLEALLASGVLGFKCFLVDSGLDAFPRVEPDELRTVVSILSAAGVPLLVHAELPEPIRAAREGCGLSEIPTSYDAYRRSRPVEAEVAAVDAVIRLSETTGLRSHVVHVSAEETTERIARARGRGTPVTAETCPHYLTFDADRIQDGATAFKCAPPIRTLRHREALWQSLAEGVLDLIASDHSPCPPALKNLDTGDFTTAWGGISALQLSLPAVWTQARARGHTPLELTRWMSEAPARLAGLQRRKGRIAVGFDADFTIWDPEASFDVVPERLEHRHAVTPYADRTLFGRVQTTVVRGRVVYDAGQVVENPRGKWMKAGSG